MEAIRIEGFRKTYGQTVAVKDLHLTVAEGEIFSLLGVNGAGKTTTVKMLSCLALPDAGDALIMGHSIRREPERVKELIDVSMQETSIARNLTVKENILFYATLSGQSREDAERTLVWLTGLFGFETVLAKKAKTLSGGWQRKLSIALALASHPKVLFLDEPTLGLDVIARRELWKTVRELKGDITIVLTTHYMEEAEALSDRIGIMKDGELLTVGTLSDILTLSGKQNLEEAFIEIVTGGDGNEIA